MAIPRVRHRHGMRDTGTLQKRYLATRSVKAVPGTRILYVCCVSMAHSGSCSCAPAHVALPVNAQLRHVLSRHLCIVAVLLQQLPLSPRCPRELGCATRAATASHITQPSMLHPIAPTPHSKHSTHPVVQVMCTTRTHCPVSHSTRRRQFPASVWSQIKSLLDSRPAGTSMPHAVDLGCKGGDCSVQLANMGARVTGVDEDVHALVGDRLSYLPCMCSCVLRS